MKTKSLIILGALCQKMFDMKDGFEVSEFIHYDPSHSVIIRRPMIEDETLMAVDDRVLPVGPGIVSERVDLILFGNAEEDEYWWCGYSSKANTLCVMPSK